MCRCRVESICGGDDGVDDGGGEVSMCHSRERESSDERAMVMRGCVPVGGASAIWHTGHVFGIRRSRTRVDACASTRDTDQGGALISSTIGLP